MDKAKIAEGLSLLVDTKAFAKRVRQINQIVDEWEQTPLVFAGPLEPLNALVDVGLTNRPALVKLIALAASKRRSVPLTKRVDYQRELMREKRERAYRAVKLEELVRGVPLRGEQRKVYMRDVQTKWMKDRNDFVAAKGNLSWKDRNKAALDFWSQLDAQLAKDLEKVKTRR